MWHLWCTSFLQSSLGRTGLLINIPRVILIVQSAATQLSLPEDRYPYVYTMLYSPHTYFGASWEATKELQQPHSNQLLSGSRGITLRLGILFLLGKLVPAQSIFINSSIYASKPLIVFTISTDWTVDGYSWESRTLYMQMPIAAVTLNWNFVFYSYSLLPAPGINCTT